MVIGITVSTQREFPPQLQKLNNIHTIIHIYPGELYRKIRQCDAVYVWSLALEELIDVLKSQCTPNLKNIFIARQGHTPELDDISRLRGISVHYASGVFSRSISEFVLASLLMLSKNLHVTVSQHNWSKHVQLPIDGSRALLLGRGSISNMTMQRLKSVGMVVSQIGTKDVIAHTTGHLNNRKSMASIDHVVNCLPLHRETHGILDYRFFSNFDNVNFVNVSRGAVINTGNFMGALNSNFIRAAVLDAFEVEPLPLDDELWQDARIVISPHQSYRSPDWDYLLHDDFISKIKDHATIVK